jgi:anti-sigma factor RsiW
MKCSQAKSLLSPYLDGAVTGNQMRDLDRHISSCIECNQNYVSLRQTQQLLGKMGRRQAPADLALKLRVAVSREAARARQSSFTGIRVRFENALNAFMVPAMAGLTAAVVVFGVLMGFMALPLQADNPDVPLMLYTEPQLQASAFPTTIDSIRGDSLVIEAYVDSNGRVQDYRILSNPKDS